MSLSGRALTYAKDKLAALAGVAIIIGLVSGNSVRDRYLAGLLGVSACPATMLETGRQDGPEAPARISCTILFVGLGRGGEVLSK